MAGRRISARRMSMSRAAKRHLRKAKRREKLGIPPEKPEASRKGFWILVIAALIVLGFVASRVFGG